MNTKLKVNYTHYLLSSYSISTLVIITFVIVQLLGIFLPVYSDEIVTKWPIARFFIDLNQKTSLFPHCLSTLESYISYINYPATIIYSLIYKNFSPFMLRCSGIIFSLALFLGFAYWCIAISKSKKMGFYLFAIIIACSASLGVVPFIMIFSRPEQLMMIIILMLFLYCLFWQPLLSKRAQYAAIAGFLITSSCFFILHPKTFFFLPFFIAVAYYITKPMPSLVKFIVIACLLIIITVDISDSNLYAKCQLETPQVMVLFNVNTLLPSGLIKEPTIFLTKGIINLISMPERIIPFAMFQQSYQSSWLPTISSLNNFEQYLNWLITALLYLLIISSHIGVLLVFLYEFFNKPNISKSIVLAVFLVVASAANSFFYNLWNFYSLTQIIPISIILILVLFSVFYKNTIPNSFKRVSLVLMCIAMISMATLLYRSMPLMIINSKTLNSDIKDQYLSVPTFSESQHFLKIRSLAKKCGIPLLNSKYLILDHQTYFAFAENKFPIHVLYISEAVYGKDLINGKLGTFIRKINSPGLLTRCSYLSTSPQLMEYSRIESEGYCCINFKRDLNKV